MPRQRRLRSSGAAAGAQDGTAGGWLRHRRSGARAGRRPLRAGGRGLARGAQPFATASLPPALLPSAPSSARYGRLLPAGPRTRRHLPAALPLPLSVFCPSPSCSCICICFCICLCLCLTCVPANRCAGRCAVLLLFCLPALLLLLRLLPLLLLLLLHLHPLALPHPLARPCRWLAWLMS